MQNKVTFVLAVAVAALAGGMTSAVVIAAIPDGGGVIHGCFKMSNGALRVIDSAIAGCSASETALSWNQSGSTSDMAWKGYGYVKQDGTLDPTRSVGIASFSPSPTNFDAYCIVTDTTPILVSTGGGSGVNGVVRGADVTTDRDIDTACNATTQVMVNGVGQGIYFFFL